MDPTVKRLLVVITCVTGVLIVAIIGLAWWWEARALTGDRIAYWKFYLDATKMVLTGFFVVLLGALIPHGFSQARHRFERLKESRIAFSRAKTGVDYLPVRLCALNLKEAGAAVQQLHVWKHRAELYAELQDHLRWRGDHITAKEWGDLMYEHLSGIRHCLENSADKWDSLPQGDRLKKLKAAGEAADENWKKDHSHRANYRRT
jgi:hypothetical protein